MEKCKVFYVEGESGYTQGIKGAKNFDHTAVSKGKVDIFNGFGGKREFELSKLFLAGYINGEYKEMSIKGTMLRLFEREKISEKFAKQIIKMMPTTVGIIIDSDGDLDVDEDCKKIIYAAIHPRKAKKKF